MGWIEPHEQQNLLTIYGKQAEFRCNYCKQPIFIDQLPVFDTKGGFYPRPEGMPTFLPSHPKKTYHQKCNDIKTGRAPKDYPLPGVLKAAPKAVKKQEPEESNYKKAVRAVRELLKRKPKKNYWMKTKIVQTIYKQERISRPALRKAIKVMIVKGKIRKNGRYLWLVKSKTN